jgi:hypothetical protein
VSLKRWIVSAAAALVLAATPAVAQQGLIQQGHRVFPEAPDGLAAPELTTEAIVAARGNVLRWRDETRARIGPYSRENEALNIRMRTEYYHARSAEMLKRRRDRENVPEPTYLPVGPILPVFGGYFAYFGVVDGAQTMTVLSGSWRDTGSNVGEASSVRGLAMLPDAFCGIREVSLADLTYLGPAYTPEIAALNRAWLGPRQAPVTLSGADLKFSRTPIGGEFFRYYPIRALERAMEGSVSMLCDIGESSALACAIAWEAPIGWGFGEAALRLAADGYRVDPVLRDGGPSAGRKVCLSTAFRLAD